MDIKSDWGQTALTAALEKGYRDIAKVLLEAGVDVVDTFSGNWQGLHLAAKHGYLDIIQTMLGKGAPVDRPAGEANATPLMLAAGNGHLEIVKLLVEKGANLEAQSVDTMFERDYGPWPFEGTPLMWAANGSHLEVVQYLLERGANPTATNQQGQTALTVAKEHGHQKIVRLLKEAQQHHP
ncbi:MAG: hypothetical protein A3C53_02395 [Omnitrophica WOR_2 bacterium RIFCSPHIGHO2_02_FULL_68_15]|nr:MAG: hypothetical protein A3C53_02395 [Omnitrophica WOR_2 bacterium RIFCSPHIGHO2_02_FULL_68_15]